jgi:MFS family permease
LWQALGNRRIAAVLLLGLASGLPYNLTDATLQAWLKDTGITNTTIGLLSLIGLAYTVKPLWAPLLDRFAIPFLGRRRGWILVFQIAIAGPCRSRYSLSSSPCCPPRKTSSLMPGGPIWSARPNAARRRRLRISAIAPPRTSPFPAR